MKRILMGILCAMVLSGGSVAAGELPALEFAEVEYAADGVSLQGYLVFNGADQEKRPGILVVPEWWGLNDYARDRAQLLAQLGYTALAVDMYGDGRIAESPQDAAALSGAVNADPAAAQRRFEAALAVLRAQPTVDPDKLAAIGYCFGGGIVLQMARRGVPLAGVVSFHGSLDTQDPAAAGAVRARILVCQGAADNFVPAAAVEKFKKEMDGAGADYTVIVYAGAKHSFTNPSADILAREFSLDIGYNPAADRQSWQDMQDFFAGIFGGD